MNEIAVSDIALIITVLVVTVAFLAQIGKARRKKKTFVDSQTQTQYTFVRTVYFDWKPPKIVPLAKWKLSWGTPEVWRFNVTDNPFYTPPILTAGQIKPTAGTKESEDFDRIANLVGGEANLVNGPPADA